MTAPSIKFIYFPWQIWKLITLINICWGISGKNQVINDPGGISLDFALSLKFINFLLHHINFLDLLLD